jgi:hypothetical protein
MRFVISFRRTALDTPMPAAADADCCAHQVSIASIARSTEAGSVGSSSIEVIEHTAI